MTNSGWRAIALSQIGDKIFIGRRVDFMMSITGIPKYDRLATELAVEFPAFIKAVQENGWIVKQTTKLPADTIACFFPRKRRFYFDPQRMTVLDMMHEQQHLELFKQRGNWKTCKGQVWCDELAVYTFELELGKREGFSRKYMEYLTRRVEFYQARLTATPTP